MTPEQIREQVPHDARLFPLLQPGVMVNGKISNGKTPRTEHAHWDAEPLEQFLELYVQGNFGIALDDGRGTGQFLLVDKDRDDPATSAFEARLPDTWSQKTWKRGTHRLYRVPKGFEGKNGRWPGGDLKVHGYLVGPGSFAREGALEGVYEILDARDPEQAPEWLLDMVRADRVRVELPGSPELDVIQAGATGGPGRDNALTQIAGFYRRQGYSEKFMREALTGLVGGGLVEQPEGDEITSADIERIARSAAKWTPEPSTGPGPISAADWVCGSDVRIVGPTVRWWERGFIPFSELVMMFGAKGVGKSSVSSWLAARVTSAGKPFLYVGVEEPFSRFLGRAVLCGADRSKIFAIPQASRLVIPRDVPALREQVKLAGTGVVYFDSILTHFEHVQGQNIAERTRRCLGPLAEMAQEVGVTVVGVFHENREGEYMGSAEMVNVARVVLQAERQKEQPMILTVRFSNLWEPPHAMVFEADEIELHDPATGEVQTEEVDGQVVAMTIRVPKMTGYRKLGIRVGDVGSDDED